MCRRAFAAAALASRGRCQARASPRCPLPPRLIAGGGEQAGGPLPRVGSGFLPRLSFYVRLLHRRANSQAHRQASDGGAGMGAGRARGCLRLRCSRRRGRASRLPARRGAHPKRIRRGSPALLEAPEELRHARLQGREVLHKTHHREGDARATRGRRIMSLGEFFPAPPSRTSGI